MTIPTSGPITATIINQELGLPANNPVGLEDYSRARKLANILTGPVSYASLRGKTYLVRPNNPVYSFGTIRTIYKNDRWEAGNRYLINWPDPNALWISWTSSYSAPTYRPVTFQINYDSPMAQDTRIMFAADDTGTCYVNGVYVGVNNDWSTPTNFSTSLLPGYNLISVVLVNKKSKTPTAFGFSMLNTSNQVLFSSNYSWSWYYS